MRFRPAVIRNSDAGRHATVWLPEEPHNRPFIREGDNYTDIEVDGNRRIAISSVIKTAADFVATRHRRAELGHDCAIFALACETNATLADQGFYPARSKTVKVGSYVHSGLEDEPKEPDIEAGQIAFTSMAVPAETGPQLVNPHFLVRATVDTGRTLYISKFGRTGPVALSTFEASLDFYPAKVAGRASDFSIIDHPSS